MRYIPFLFIFISIQCLAQTDWELSKDKEGIQVFTRKSSQTGFNDIKIEMDIKGTLQQLKDIILDVPAYPEWVFATPISRVTNVLSPNELVYYSVIDVPWPATDRDLFASIVIDLDPAAGHMYIVSNAVTDLSEKEKNKIRIPWSLANWTVTKIDDHTIHVQYTLSLDPGGSVPPWLLNLFSVQGPFNTFQSLKARMQKLVK